MLVKLLPYTPFEAPRAERLIVLESQLRRRSEGTMALRDYVAWLEQAEVKLPASRRTLHEDLRRYADFCDDVSYADGGKKLFVDTRPTRDATAWLMGQAWADSPLKPHLPSAMVRCLLLAMSERAELCFGYRKLREPGEPWGAEAHYCLPLRLIAGTDAAYMEVLGAQGGIYTLSISRISARLAMTDKTWCDYPPEPPRRGVRLRLQVSDKQVRERLSAQFSGLREKDKQTLEMALPESQLRMTLDLLAAYLARTRSAKRSPDKLPPLPGVAFSYELIEPDANAD